MASASTEPGGFFNDNMIRFQPYQTNAVRPFNLRFLAEIPTLVLAIQGVALHCCYGTDSLCTPDSENQTLPSNLAQRYDPPDEMKHLVPHGSEVPIDVWISCLHCAALEIEGARPFGVNCVTLTGNRMGRLGLSPLHSLLHFCLPQTSAQGCCIGPLLFALDLPSLFSNFPCLQ